MIINIVENLFAFYVFNESIWIWSDFNFLIYMMYTIIIQRNYKLDYYN